MIQWYAIQEALKDMLAAYSYTDNIKNFYVEAMDRDQTFHNMPFVNVGLSNAFVELRSIPDGYHTIIPFNVGIVTYDLSHFRKAAIVRDRILRERMIAVQTTPRFHADVMTSIVGENVEFDNEQLETKGYVATVAFTVNAEINVEPV